MKPRLPCLLDLAFRSPCLAANEIIIGFYANNPRAALDDHGWSYYQSISMDASDCWNGTCQSPVFAYANKRGGADGNRYEWADFSYMRIAENRSSGTVRVGLVCYYTP